MMGNRSSLEVPVLRRSLALTLALAPLAGCVVESESRRSDVAWVKYEKDRSRWQDDHARWEQQKAARDRRVQQSLERQWPQPTAAAPDDPLAPEALAEPREARPVARHSSGSSSSSDWTPPPPNHYVPEDERVVVERSSSVDVDVSLGVGYVGYGTYVGPRVYHRPRYVGSYYSTYYDPCPPRRVYSNRCAPTVYVPRRRAVFVQPRPYCPPVYRAPAYCPPARVSFTNRSHGHHSGGHGHHGGNVRSFSARPSAPAAPAPAAPAMPSWATKN
jgi:hypothetical protein